MSDDFNFFAARNAAPSLNSPALLVAASQDPTDPAGSAQTLAHAAEKNAASAAIQHVKHSSNVMGHLFGAVGHVFHAAGELPGVETTFTHAMDWMNAPVALFQHEYRYAHDVEARHGASAFFGYHFWTDSPSSSHLYGDSWDRTAEGEKYTDDGNKVSIGRDLTSLIPWVGERGTTRFSVASGLLDAIFDIGTDPTLAAGKLNKAGRIVDMTKGGAALEDISKLQQTRLMLAKSITLKDADSFDVALEHSPRVQHAVQKIIDAKTPSGVRALLPRATDDEIRDLAKAGSVDAVRQIYLDGMYASNVLNKAPILSLMSPVSTRLRQIGVKDAQGSEALGKAIAGGDDTSGLSQATKRRERFQRRFLTRLPLDASPDNTNPMRSFHLNGPNAGDIVHGITKYSFDEKVANAVRDAFVETTDLTRKHAIYVNAVKAAAWNMGFKDLDAGLWRQFASDMDNNMIRVKAYGVDGNTGHLLDGAIAMPDRAGGSGTTAAALFSQQTGRAQIPHFNDIRDAIATAKQFETGSKLKAMLSPWDSGLAFKADDFFYRHVTQPVFKRLALFSGGFALRIGLGEGLYQGLDDGVVKFLKSQVNTVAAKQGYKLGKDEQGAVMAALVHTGLHRAPNAETEIGIRLMLAHDGHVLPHELDADHIGRDSIEAKTQDYVNNYKKMASKRERLVESGKFTKIDSMDEHYNYFYAKHLREIAESPEGRVLAQLYIKNGLDDVKTVAAHAKFLQSAAGRKITRNMDRGSDYALHHNDGYVGFSGQQLNALKGALSGEAGEVNQELLAALAAGKVPHPQALAAIAENAKPMTLPGREIHPATESSVDRVFNAGHQKVISPIINSLSRKGTFIRRTTQHYEILKRAGVGDDDAFRIAQQRAAHDIMPDIHNPNVRTQFSELARNYMPFYFAQDQAYRRWARLAVKDPTTLRKLQLAHQAAVNTGWVHKDPQAGQETFMYPGSGFIGAGVTGLLGHLGIHTLDGVPLSFSGNVSSLSTVTPFAETPGLRLGGPMTGIPLALLEKFAPESAPMVQAAQGPKGGSSSLWDMILPNKAISNLATAVGSDHSRSFQSAQMQALQTVFYNRLNGLAPEDRAAFLSDPQMMQSLVDESKTYARTLFVLKAVIGEGLPTQPHAEIGDVKMRGEFAQLLKDKGTVGEALEAFQTKHPGEDLSPFAVFQSEGKAGGYIPPSQQAVDYFEENRDLIRKLPYGAAWLIPQKGEAGDALKIYNEELAVGMRKKRTPEEFTNQLYVSAGNAQYYNLRDQRDEALAMYGDRDASLRLQQGGRTVPSLVSDDMTLRKQISEQWTQVAQSLAQMNPVWASQQGDKTRAVNRERALQDFSVLFDPQHADKVPQNEQYGMVRDLYAQYQTYHNARVMLVQQPGTGLSDQIKALDEQWQSYLQSTAKGTPELAPVIQSVFREVK